MSTRPAQSAMVIRRKSRKRHDVAVVPWLHLSVAMRRLFVLVTLWVAACGPPGIDAPDAGDDGGDGDVEMAGLEFRWSAPALDMAIGDVVITELRLKLRDIRAVGDASGDETYRAAQEIQLSGEDQPTIVFAEAPPGRYSAFEFQLERSIDGDSSWEIRGDCTLDDTTYGLEIEDEAPLAVTLPLDLVLAPGQTRIIHVEVDLERFVQGIDWSLGQIEDDKLVVEEDSPLMPGLRANLLASFSIARVD